jgi:hypothetical protein
MRVIFALVAAAALLAAACGPEAGGDLAGTRSPLPVAAGSLGGQELDCPDDQREALVRDFDTDPDGGYRTPRAALRTYLGYKSAGDRWPPSDDFESQGRVAREPDYVVFEYRFGGRHLASVWTYDLGRSWLVTAHEVCKEVFEKPQETRLPNKFRSEYGDRLIALPGLGRLSWECRFRPGEEARFLSKWTASKSAATQEVEVKVDGDRWERRTVQPGDSLSSSLRKADFNAWTVEQRQEPATTLLRLHVSFDQAGGSCIVPTVEALKTRSSDY